MRFVSWFSRSANHIASTLVLTAMALAPSLGTRPKCSDGRSVSISAARRSLQAAAFAIFALALLVLIPVVTRAQGCPQIIVNGATPGRGASGGNVNSIALGSAGRTSAGAGGTVHTNSAPCNTPPSIMITPIGGTQTTAAPFLIIEYCSPNYGIDMATNSVKLNGVVIDSHGGMGTMLSSTTPDTMPNSGFCGVPARGPMTGQEIGRIRLRQGPDTLIASVCDDVGHCATKTNVYTYTPTWPVAVTPDDSLVRVFSAQADVATFTLHRTDTDTTTGKYALVRTCTGVAVGTCAGADTITLKGGETKTINVTFTGGTSISSGRIKLKATLTTNAAMTDSGSDSVIASIPGVAITPKNLPLNAAVNAHNTAFFTATNTGPIAATYNFAGVCGGADTACVASMASQLIAAGAPLAVTVGYKSEALGSTGTVKLRGVHATIPTAKDSATSNTTAITPSAMTTAAPASLTNVERGLCLTVAAGHGAASECGTLRLAHALPSIRTLNKSRTPTLIYNSAFAHPEAVVPLDVTLPSTMPVPDSVTVTLTINSAVRASAKWTGIEWGYAQTRRVVLGFDAINDSSGHYPWTAQASSWYGSTRYNSSATQGALAVVNRARSNFGAGWWLAGLEKLYTLPSDGSKLWIGGDGSTRHFLNISGVSNAWTVPKLDSPDSLTFDGTYYHHILPHGLTVLFDATGRHVKTINRLKDTTTFFYTGQRLDSLQVPPTSLGKRYVFTYDAASPNRLLSVAAPRLPSRTRLTTITTSGGRITAIKEPDSTVVGFGYTLGDTNRITSRTDRNGVVGTFAYNAAKMLVRDSIDMDTTGAPIVTNFRPYESVGWAPTSVDTALTYGLIDGPRTDVGDTTLFWLDQFQQPRHVRNALGQDSYLSRANATYPALVTRMQAPNGRVVLAAYDSHGNVATSTDSGTCISGTCATTTYLWDQKWDFVRRVTAPLGEVSLSSYDQTYGNKDWQSIDADSAIRTHRVSFTYDVTRHLVSSVQEPLITGQQRVWYDGAGNLDSVKSPTNIPTRFYSDSLGRDTLVRSAIDYGDTSWVMSKTTYDVSDQTVYEQTSSFPQTDLSTVLHGRKYDAEGNVIVDSVQASPDINAIGWVRHAFTYDRANRKRQEFPDGVGGSSSFVYDPASNVVAWTPRGYVANTTSYDALNRPMQRVVPSRGTGGLQTYTYGQNFLADTLTYTYDIAGNMTAANNIFAKIARAYNLNGTLAADTERVRESDSASSAFPHVYGVRYGYDLENRRLWMKHPATLALTGRDSVAYTYDALTGMPTSVTDPYGNRFSMTYDAALRLASDTLLAGAATPLIETRSFDNESRMLGRREMLGSTSVAADTMTYDARSKRISAGFNYVDGTSGSETNSYNKLGAATKDVAPAWNDVITTDALAREKSRYSPVQGTVTTTSVYDTYGGSTLLRVLTAHPGVIRDTTDNSYNGAGALFNVITRREVAPQALPGHLTPFYARQQIKDRYGANGVMMASETHFDTVDAFMSFGPQTYFEREEYRYDALGRRIWRRLVRPDIGICNKMNMSSGCYSIVERTVWDGDQVLWEIRADGGDGATPARMEADGGGPFVRAPLEGRVFYTHGPGLDHPLSIGRLDASAGYIVPVYDWRGNAIAGYCNGTTLCSQYQWPQEAASPWDQVPPPDGGASGPTTWKGNLADTHADGSGLVYKRNRYYDPSSGRFTQEDPIGLAGGLNAYGFAGGDPVNFSDPFGLKTCPPACGDVFTQLGQMAPAMEKAIEIGTAITVAPAAVVIGSDAAAGGLTVQGARATATFYRGVSAAEAEQVASDGALKTVANSAEGKFLTNTAEAAAEWGTRMNGAAGRVVQVTLPAAAAKGMEYLGRIDGIGKAWFATMDQLKDAVATVLPK